ncbi:hypothetical protein P8935_01570 [Telmatobacter sp. DSM 110680]|uniref:Secreted protein n=1 Tax=Telmatobacter sp. DSM 110680 TaxID=3036704 RepID=A0AAU7DLR5_9BACT
MFPKRSAVAACAAFICCTMGPRILHAASAQQFYIPIVNATFSPACSSVSGLQVTLNGQYHFVVHTSKNHDGTFTTKIQSNATGTATDNNGGKYVFNYVNHEQDLSSTPADVPPILGIYSDRFQLVSKGGDPNVKVQYQIAFMIDGSGTFTPISVMVFKGDPNCDPI